MPRGILCTAQLRANAIKIHRPMYNTCKGALRGLDEAQLGAVHAYSTVGGSVNKCDCLRSLLLAHLVLILVVCR